MSHLAFSLHSICSINPQVCSKFCIPIPSPSTVFWVFHCRNYCIMFDTLLPINCCETVMEVHDEPALTQECIFCYKSLEHLQNSLSSQHVGNQEVDCVNSLSFGSRFPHHKDLALLSNIKMYFSYDMLCNTELTIRLVDPHSKCYLQATQRPRR